MFELTFLIAGPTTQTVVSLYYAVFASACGLPVDRCHGGRLYGDDAVLAGDRAAVRQPDADRRKGKAAARAPSGVWPGALRHLIFLLTENLLGRAGVLDYRQVAAGIVGVTVISLRNLIMAQYKETNRFHCESSSGAHYVVIEQIPRCVWRWMSAKAHVPIT